LQSKLFIFITSVNIENLIIFYLVGHTVGQFSFFFFVPISVPWRKINHWYAVNSTMPLPSTAVVALQQ